MDHIGQQFNTYREQVIPADAGQVQVVECRRAFYAGAAALWGIIFATLGPGGEPTENELNAMGDIDAELKEFLEELKAGSA